MTDFLTFFTPILPYIEECLTVAWVLYIISLIIIVLLGRHPPVSTLAWILTLAFLPYVGFLIYHFLGPRKMHRQRARRMIANTMLLESAATLEIRNQISSENKYERESLQLATLIQNTTHFPISTARRLRLLVNGNQTYKAIFSAISGARDHIHLEYYIFEPDHTGSAMISLLTRKAKEGVKVRLLVDGLGSSSLKPRHVKDLTEAGAEFAYFNKPHLSRMYKPLVNLRTHRKIVVVDGTHGFTGGHNITDDENERINDKAFHDMHLEMTGSAVNWLQLAFFQDWIYATESTEQKIPDTERYFPVHPVGEYPVHIIASGPDDNWEILHRTLANMIHAARERIWLTTPYFVPTEATLLALSSAALRGVDVRILVPRKSDSAIVTAAARSYFDELIAAGVKIWEYKGRMLHAKTLVLDDRYGMIGTANFDQRSFRLNFEVSVLSYGKTLNAELAKQFDIDLKSSERVRYLPRISVAYRLFEASARLLSPLL